MIALTTGGRIAMYKGELKLLKLSVERLSKDLERVEKLPYEGWHMKRYITTKKKEIKRHQGILQDKIFEYEDKLIDLGVEVKDL